MVPSAIPASWAELLSYMINAFSSARNKTYSGGKLPEEKAFIAIINRMLPHYGYKAQIVFGASGTFQLSTLRHRARLPLQ
jgi:hypothetical protein